MVVKSWYQLGILVLCLVIADQFFKLATRYVTPKRALNTRSLSVGYQQKPGWINRTHKTPVKIAVKNLFLSQNGLFTLLLLGLVLVLFQKNVYQIQNVRTLLPYAFISAAIISLWLDNIGIWAPQSLQIRWLHINGPVKLALSWTEIYIAVGVLLFLLRFRRNEIPPPA